MTDIKRQIIHEAEIALENTRREGRELTEKARKEVYEKIPRIKEIDSEVKALGLSVAKSARRGEFSSKLSSEVKKEIIELSREKKDLLKKNGFPQNYLESRYKCAKCADTGVLDASYCDCRTNLLKTLMYAHSGLGGRRLASFDKFNIALYDEEVRLNGISSRKNAQKILEQCMKFEHGNLLFYGETGLGKTFLSECIANEFIKRGMPVFYMSAPKMFQMLDKSRFGRDETPETKQRIAHIYDADLLVIDDLGAEFRSQSSDSFLFDIVNSRILEDKSTIITLNIPLNELGNHYSERIASRLAGDYTAFKFFGEDIRLKNKKKKKLWT